MTNKSNIIVTNSNITLAWLEAIEHLLDKGVEQLTHFTLRLNDFSDGFPTEFRDARARLDLVLKANGPCTTNENANLLFPESAWKIQRQTGATAQEFLKHYHDNLMPRLKTQDKRNKNGTYFDRMVAYPDGEGHVNQLGQLLALWQDKKLRRQSAYQVAIYHPGKDLKATPYLGFPCLDHIAFTKDGDELYMSAFYAGQAVFSRGYGNYLGLCKIGRFMGEQMGLRFTQFSCHVAMAKLQMSGKKKKDHTKPIGPKEIRKLAQEMRATIAENTTEENI